MHPPESCCEEEEELPDDIRNQNQNQTNKQVCAVTCASPIYLTY